MHDTRHQESRILRLAVIGMIPGNGHPYSWSSIINGFDEDEIEKCPYALIPRYLKNNRGEVGIQSAQVTHIWTDNSEDAKRVAAAARIKHIVSHPEEVCGSVDAVLIATDDGDRHSKRARPFIEYGLPVFIDKPLATTVAELEKFLEWRKAGARLMSCSGARYDPGVDQLRDQLSKLGELRWITCVMTNTWERYGIHRIEPLFQLLGPGFKSISLGPRVGRTELATVVHEKGITVSLNMAEDAGVPAPLINLVGTTGQFSARLDNYFVSFKRQLEAFIQYARTGVESIDFKDTIEMMSVIIAGIESRNKNGEITEIGPLLEKFIGRRIQGR